MLFIVPGILFFIWFSLAIFILVFEERKGFDALFRSKHLVKGKFWEILLRLLTPVLIIAVGLFLIFLPIHSQIEDKQIFGRIQASSELNYFYKPNQIQIIFAEWYRNFIENINKDCNEVRFLKSETLPSSPIKLLFIENVLGKIFHKNVILNLSDFLEKNVLKIFQ
ncbi:MAG: hypothetical protein NC833_06605 [Candidatus Omnitrophica bacterium]|nr:hypothetical protein [Candidatus Omnitrophota bacterium]